METGSKVGPLILCRFSSYLCVHCTPNVASIVFITTIAFGKKKEEGDESELRRVIRMFHDSDENSFDMHAFFFYLHVLQKCSTILGRKHVMRR
jgi:hypothetical protein